MLSACYKIRNSRSYVNLTLDSSVPKPDDSPQDFLGAIGCDALAGLASRGATGYFTTMFSVITHFWTLETKLTEN